MPKDKSVWVFDLDNTLYPADATVFPQIDRKMTAFVSQFLSVPPDEARKIQKQYYAEHGTTLKGLMQRHGMAPEKFLAEVHDVDLSALPQCERLAGAIAALPGEKYVFTNGSRWHGERVTEHMGLAHLFDGLSGIEDSRFHPKPTQESYDRFCDLHAIDPSDAVFFEDLSRNLRPAEKMGFTTVLVRSGYDWSHEPVEARPAGKGDAGEDHVHYVTDDLTAFLEDVTQNKED